MAQASPKENVLPTLAQAAANVRMIPWISSAEVVECFNQLASPFSAKAYIKFPGHIVEASEKSSTSSEGWNAIAKAVSEAFPQAVSAPFFTASTKTKHYRALTDDIHRFTPLVQTQEDIAAVHNVYEEVSIENLERCPRFYRSLMQEC